MFVIYMYCYEDYPELMAVCDSKAKADELLQELLKTWRNNKHFIEEITINTIL